MGKELQEAASAKFKHGQTFISQTWGLSENTGSATLNNFGEVDTSGSVSRLLPNMRLRYVQSASPSTITRVSPHPWASLSGFRPKFSQRSARLIGKSSSSFLSQKLTVYRIVDDDGKDVEVGKEGELLLKGPIVFKGYHNNPEASKDAFDSEGYFRTGDIGMFQNGMFYIVDRKKELIKYKGVYL